MAIEDAAVLGNLLSHLSHPAQIHPLLNAYESLRLERTANTQASSRDNQRIFHYPDGPEQQARDDEMRRAMAREKGLPCENANDEMQGNANQWADKATSLMQFGYDADMVADKWWNEVGEKVYGSFGERILGRL